MSYAGAAFWDQFHRQRRESGRDLDWQGLWTKPFLGPLRDAGVRTVLELGCGTGNDAARLAGQGYSVTATDLSAEAIGQARAKFGSAARFMVVDVTRPLPFPDGEFDAVMSNVALHMFPDLVTRAAFAEVGRVVRRDGLLLFHVNALEDRPLRARRLRPVRELEPDYVAEESGQTMHFFSEAYLRDLLGGWQELELTSVVNPGRRDQRAVQAGLARNSHPLTTRYRLDMAVAWDRVTRDDVLRAMQEYDQLGSEQFFAAHGFGQSRSYELVFDGRRYPHKAILGTAYELATGHRLGSGDFEGGKAGAVKVLGKLGFAVQPL